MSRSRWRCWFRGLCLWLLLAVPGVAQSADASARQIQDTVGWHVVQAGETLQSITAKYLGTPHLWPENHKLNPQIRDPHLLWPGQRIKVIVERQIPAQSAEIEKISNEVDKNLQLTGWQQAQAGDALKPKDGVRTFEDSSAALRFDDGSNLTLNEYSQVFLKEMQTTVTGVRQGEITIERGQADFKLQAPKPEKSDIAIVVGTTVSRPRPGPGGTAETRTRLAASGVSQLMVFGGSSELEAGGLKVAVATGMGTSVTAGEAPKPPEPLLPAAALESPPEASQWNFANPHFAWQPVPGAASYNFEVCRDSACTQLVGRTSELKTPSFQPVTGLPRGLLFWRVQAVAPSGLDGYSSKPRSLHILSENVDLEPPLLAVAVVGAGDVRPDGVVLLGPGGALRWAARDDASGVAAVRYRWADAAWQLVAGADIAAPAGEGEPVLHVLQLAAVDHLGRQRTLEVRVHSTASEPLLPPTARRGVEPR